MSTALYANAQVLLKDQHRSLRLDREAANYNFARKVMSAPVAGVEFEPTAARMPIVFITLEGTTGPVALTGLNPEGDNTLIDDDGVWQGYVPAWFRRYPFAQNDKDMVCFDPDCNWLNENGDKGELLFNEDGNATETLNTAVALLSAYKNDLETTRGFTEKLIEWDLLQDLSVQFASGGKSMKLEGMKMVNATKMKELPEDKVMELFKVDQLGWIYFHLASLQHLTQVLN